MKESLNLEALLRSVSFGTNEKIVTVLVFLLTVYISYQRFWHPLARYPGPFLASLTDVWQVREWLTGKQPYRLTRLHAKYGPIVRYGPDKLSVTCKDAVQTVYVRGHKTMPKTEYYNAFGQPHDPNLFNQRNQADHAVRRRVLLKAFSPQAVETYEPILDFHTHRLIENIEGHCRDGKSFDLKKTIYHFVCDAISDLMYGEDLGIQKGNSVDALPDDHTISLWSAAIGSWPTLQPILSIFLLLFPHPRSWMSFRNMLGYFLEAKKIVKNRLVAMLNEQCTERKDILSRIIGLKDSDLENKLNEANLAAETFGFLIAGIHPPSATMILLFYNLLHNKEVLDKAIAEIDLQLPPMTPGADVYSRSAVDTKLPYFRNCIKESFRISPAFTMPLARRVTQSEGIVLEGNLVPVGTSVAICNQAFHHNPKIWGDDHNCFHPSRWEDEANDELGKLLMHFGAGGRQCIGKSLALTVIYKTTATLLARFSFQLVNEKEQQDVEDGLFYGKLPDQVSVGISDLKGSLMVKASDRARMQ
ncbi:Benzoate 4-monooxygenase [Penicillium malachiteum]|uniref:Benzoate 4-monooxygenase n=1 Tax=Penicillium malachiteum TaxID=1324776 RepID=UPI002549376C|nr:Benzoate 4-monooxygenase [Penicillium malachiteum]KAJ5714360.1 Benzoate 4-monooxygenase [Penicillium malachiteum]